jgi:hypothetical protein
MLAPAPAKSGKATPVPKVAKVALTKASKALPAGVCKVSVVSKAAKWQPKA